MKYFILAALVSLNSTLIAQFPFPDTLELVATYATVYSKPNYEGEATKIRAWDVNKVYLSSDFPDGVGSLKLAAGYQVILKNKYCRLKMEYVNVTGQIYWECKSATSIYKQNVPELPFTVEPFSIWENRLESLQVQEIPPASPTIRITLADWRQTLNGIFSTTAMRLNNYTPIPNQYFQNERQFLKPDDSYFKLNFNGYPFRYPIPIDVMEVGPDNMFKLYVNDWNSNTITAVPENRRIRVTLTMEDDGVEILGNCYNNFSCGFTSPPQFNYYNSKIDIYLTLKPVNGHLSYDAEAIFTANVSESGPCVDNVFAFLCPSNRASIIKSKLETKLNDILNEVTVKTLLGSVLDKMLPATTQVKEVRILDNGDIEIVKL